MVPDPRRQAPGQARSPEPLVLPGLDTPDGAADSRRGIRRPPQGGGLCGDKPDRPAGVAPRFVDDAEAAGLRFVQDNGQTPRKLLPETMSGGVALLDYDGDGWLDIYVVQGGAFPPPANPVEGDRLYRNRGDGTFEDATGRAGTGPDQARLRTRRRRRRLRQRRPPDLFVTRWRAYALLHNRGDGTFEEVTDRAGLGGDRDWPTSAAFADLDGDGDLDLYVCHYLAFDVEEPRICSDAASRVAHYCSPRISPSLPDHVFRNDGGRFVDVTAAPGSSTRTGAGWEWSRPISTTITASIFMSPTTCPRTTCSATTAASNSRRRRSRPARRPTRAGASSRGWASPAATSTATDGPTWPSPTITASRRRCSGTWAGASSPTQTAAVGLAAPSRHLLGFGIAFLDANNDGRLDLVSANGHVSDYRPAFPWKMPIQLLVGTPEGRLIDVSAGAGPRSGRSTSPAAWPRATSTTTA